MTGPGAIGRSFTFGIACLGAWLPRILFWLVVIAWVLTSYALANGCTHMCAKTWESSSTVGREYGLPNYGTTVTVGGGLGEMECGK